MSGEIRSETMLCKAYLVEEITHDYFKLRNPLKLFYSKHKGTFSVFINELEIFANSEDLDEAICQVFCELFTLYEVICNAPTYRTLNDEVCRYRRFLSTHLERLN